MSARYCEWDECEQPATHIVRTIRGDESLCKFHAWRTREIEREWDEAEAQMLEQF